MKNLKLNKRQKRKLIRIAISLFCFALIFAFFHIFDIENAFNRPISWLLPFLIWLILYAFIGYDVLIKAVQNIFSGQFLDENFLMVVATFGAFALGIFNGIKGNKAEGFDEAVAVLIFYQVGQFFEQVAAEKSRKSISDLINIRPDYANLIIDGTVEQVMPEDVKIGDRLVIYPGEKIPLDCKVIKGASSINNMALTGESLPFDVKEQSELLSGGVNITSELTCEVTKEFYDSTVCKILDLVENASDKKSKAENFIAKFAKYYTPTVIILALLTAIIPSVATGDWQTWIYRSLSFLVVSCPCALVISVPMTFFVALGKASKEKILIKGSNYLELLASANVFLFDKTGTLTKGEFQIEQIFPEENKAEVLRLASIAEENSSHPIAKCILLANKSPIEKGYTLTNLSGFGVKAQKEKEVILCGNKQLLLDNNITVPSEKEGAVYVAKNNSFIGYIVIKDVVKSEVNGVIEALYKENARTVMLTGDSENTAKEIAEKCGIKEFYSNLLPQDKVAKTESILHSKGKNDCVCFIGDGINDAPVLMRSDVGISMGQIGSDAAIEASDVVLMRDNLSDLLVAKQIAKKTMKIVKQNVIFSIAIKSAVLVLSFFGITNMWFSIFGDVGVAVIAILNALRAQKN